MEKKSGTPPSGNTSTVSLLEEFIKFINQLIALHALGRLPATFEINLLEYFAEGMTRNSKQLCSDAIQRLAKELQNDYDFEVHKTKALFTRKDNQ